MEIARLLKISVVFCVAYTKCVAALWQDSIYLFVHESRAPVTWSSEPHMYALRTYAFGCVSVHLQCPVTQTHFIVSTATTRTFARLLTNHRAASGVNIITLISEAQSVILAPTTY